jgi:lysophospholipase L1-like esterase
LSASTVIGTTVNDNPNLINGVSVPLSDEYVLTQEEQNAIQAATTAYNETIAGVAEQNNLAFVDVNSILNEVNNSGIPYSGGILTSEFVTGGSFSLDGIHLTARGNALIVNRTIEAINEQYGSTVPMVNIGDFKSITPSNNVIE